MTLSEPEAPGPKRENVWSEVWLSGRDFPAGVPDPAVLARLANEFFTALPDFTQASSAVLAGPAQLPSVAASAESQMNPQGKLGIAPPAAFPRAPPASAWRDSLDVGHNSRGFWGHPLLGRSVLFLHRGGSADLCGRDSSSQFASSIIGDDARFSGKRASRSYPDRSGDRGHCGNEAL